MIKTLYSIICYKNIKKTAWTKACPDGRLSHDVCYCACSQFYKSVSPV